MYSKVINIKKSFTWKLRDFDCRRLN